jgi:hypothetical protein
MQIDTAGSKAVDQLQQTMAAVVAHRPELAGD